jgi:tetratricopeptide (TPR) repeat protein
MRPANTLKALGDVARMRNEYEEAEGRYEEALPLYEAIGARLGQANTLKALGDVARMRNEYEEAEGRYEEALPLYEAIGDRLGQANAVTELGRIAQQRKDFDTAVSHFGQALALAQSMGDTFTEARTAIYAAPSFAAASRTRQALEMALNALVYFQQLGIQGNVRVVQNLLDGLRDQVGAETFDPLWEEITGQPVPEWLSGA